MKIGYKWKAIDGLAKGKVFRIIEITSDKVTYKSEETKNVYSSDRKFFEKYIERVNKYWSELQKSYKNKKEKLKRYSE